MMPIRAQHCRPTQRHDQAQRSHGRLPFWGRVLGLRQLENVVACVSQGDKPATAGQRDRIVERSFPAAISRHAAA